MPMNTVIQEKRRALGMTQEQVAEHLGVSTAAVSKWETGLTCPDVTILPQLARLLQTDLNTLFSFQIVLSAQEISGICSEITEIGQSKGIKSAFSLAQQHLHRFPHNEKLLQCVTICLDGLINTSNLPQAELSDYENHIIVTYKKLAESSDINIQNTANYMLASKLIRLGNYDHAQTILDRMPNQDHSVADKLPLQVNVYQHQHKFELASSTLETALLAAVNRLQLLMNQLVGLELAAGNSTNAQIIAEKWTELAKLFELWEYSCYASQFQIAAKEKNSHKALPLLQGMLRSLKQPWSPQNTILFRSIDWNHNDTQSNHLMTIFRDQLEHDPEFAFLRNDKAFAALLDELRT